MIQIDRKESAAMRGIAILAIILHNYCHWLPMVQENEYQFFANNVRRLMVELAHPSWEIITHLLSFFGHYGVPVFVFLSAYGLVMKYERYDHEETPAFSFISSHYKKLFMMMIVGYAAFVMVDYMTRGPRHYEFWNVIGQLGMFSNFYTDPDKDIWPGPYWYFGLMVQIYLVYRLILYPGKSSLMGLVNKKWHDYILIGILAVTLIPQIFLEPEGLALQWYRYNVFGSLPIFIIGLLYARKVSLIPADDSKLASKTTWAMILVISGVLIFLLSLWFTTWIIVPFFICSATIALVKIMPDSILSRAAWVGGISAALFVCHPITRKVLIPISRHGDLFAGLILYIVASIVLAILFKKLIALVTESSH